ncbi:uncharacterized protein [Nerophis lumbriciformis]|uniref:uncharacterized protein n=1 Tax=Nerophis lumbriciformis TaxID=546530 RepID=UPI003BABB188
MPNVNVSFFFFIMFFLSYPVSADKKLLARTIVTLYPSLNNKMEDENEGYEHFYYPTCHTGFLEDKLRNICRKLRDDRRRYCRRSGSSEVTVRLEEVTESDESVQEWITVIKRMKPCPENLSSLKMGMDKTYFHRRYWISNQSPTLAEIVENYPYFIDMPYLIDREFEKMFPNKTDIFLRKWDATMVPKLLKLAALEGKDEPPEAESAESKCYRAVVLKWGYMYPWGYLKPGTSFHDLLQTTDPAPVMQPHLVSIGHRSTTSTQYVIVAANDYVVIPLQEEDLTCSLDKLFKLYWLLLRKRLNRTQLDLQNLLTRSLTLLTKD